QFVSAPQPLRDRAAKRFGALVRRVAAEIVEMPDQRRTDKGWDRMLRLADRDIDRRLARIDAGDQVGEAHKGGAGIGCYSGGCGRLELGGHQGHAVGRRGGASPRDFCCADNRSGEVKTRLTIGSATTFSLQKAQKREAPIPFRTGASTDKDSAGFPPSTVGRCLFRAATEPPRRAARG